MEECLPAKAPDLPMAIMPAPGTILLGALGGSQVCRPLDVNGGSNTTLCYDLATSEVQVTCQTRAPDADFEVPLFTSASSRLSNFTPESVTCKADLDLGLSDPYPCPCPVPDDVFTGYGRAPDQPLISDTFGTRDEKDILWRSMLKLFWQSEMDKTLSTINIDNMQLQPGPALAAALKLQETDGVDESQVAREMSKATNSDLYQRGVLQAMERLARVLSDALIFQMVPGQEVNFVDTSPVQVYTDIMPITETTAEAADDATMRTRTGVVGLQLDVPGRSFNLLGTAVEMDYEESEPLGFTASDLAPAFPVMVPMTGLRWKNAGTGVFSRMDPATTIYSDAVQLRLLDNVLKPTGLKEPAPKILRYRFLVPEPYQNETCVSMRPAQELLVSCCNADAYKSKVVTEGMCEDKDEEDGVQLGNRNSGTTTTTTTSAALVQANVDQDEALLMKLTGSPLPFQKGLEALFEDLRFWTPSFGARTVIAGRNIKLVGGDVKVGGVCRGSSNRSSMLQVVLGEAVPATSSSSLDLFCETVFRDARNKMPTEPAWKTFDDVLVETAFEVIADPSLLITTTATVTSTTVTETSTTTVTSTFTAYNDTSTATTSITMTTSATMTTSVTLSSTITSTVTATHTVSITSTTVTATETTMTATTTTMTATTTGCASTGYKTVAWCASAVSEVGYVPTYGGFEIADEDSVLLIDVEALQFSLQGSSAATMGTSQAELFVAAPNRSTWFLLLQSLIYSFLTPWTVEYSLPKLSDVLRDYAPDPTTTTRTTTTRTRTTKTVTTSTTTRPLVAWPPIPALPSGIILGALEAAFSDPLEVLTRALALQLENNDGLSRENFTGVDGSWGSRGVGAAQLLDSWCDVPSLGPPDLATVLDFLTPAVLDMRLTEDIDSTLRPLDEILQAIDVALPSEWSAAYWDSSVGGPNWSPPVPELTTTLLTTTTFVPTTTTAYCGATECAAPAGCGSDPLEELECVAWSAPLLRWVPALGCALAVASGRKWPLLVGESGADAMMEIICECVPDALHPVMAVARKRSVLEPFPDQVHIHTREYVVYWLDKINRYNARGLYLCLTLLATAFVHFVIAVQAERKYRERATWVLTLGARTRGVQDEVKIFHEEEEEFIRNRLKEIRDDDEAAMAAAASQAAAAMRITGFGPEAEIQQGMEAARRVDLRQEKTAVSSALVSQGVPESSVAQPPPALQSPSRPGEAPPMMASRSDVVGTPTLLSPSQTLTSEWAGISPSKGIDRADSRDPGWADRSITPASGQIGQMTIPDEDQQAAAIDLSSTPAEAMVTDVEPTQYNRTWYDAFVDAVRRCRPKHIWRALEAHHKLLSLSEDTQKYTFCAPERAMMFHLSLWINTMLLAAFLGGNTHRRPGMDPYCTGAGGNWEVTSFQCLMPLFGTSTAAACALLTTLISSCFQVIFRGRSFHVRCSTEWYYIRPNGPWVKGLPEMQREEARTRHFVAEWPMCFHEPEEAQVRLRNMGTKALRWSLKKLGFKKDGTLLKSIPRSKRLAPLHWYPSLIIPVVPFLVFALCWTLVFYMFFFSSSIYMWEVTRSDVPGSVEIVLPTNEREEAEAVGTGGLMQFRLVFVPEMQRFSVLLLLAWFLHLAIFEPILLAMHLFFGEMTIDEAIHLAGVARTKFKNLVMWIIERILMLAPDVLRLILYVLWEYVLGPIARAIYNRLPEAWQQSIDARWQQIKPWFTAGRDRLVRIRDRLTSCWSWLWGGSEGDESHPASKLKRMATAATPPTREEAKAKLKRMATPPTKASLNTCWEWLKNGGPMSKSTSRQVPQGLEETVVSEDEEEPLPPSRQRQTIG